MTNIQKAIACINADRLVQAEECLRHAMQEDMSAPEPHNLYGILLECRGERLRAIRHYRAAYALDPACKPAERNLNRITTTVDTFSKDRCDFGDQSEREPEPEAYRVEYDERGVGHIRKPGDGRCARRIGS